MSARLGKGIKLEGSVGAAIPLSTLPAVRGPLATLFPSSQPELPVTTAAPFKY